MGSRATRRLFSRRSSQRGCAHKRVTWSRQPRLSAGLHRQVARERLAPTRGRGRRRHSDRVAGGRSHRGDHRHCSRTQALVFARSPLALARDTAIVRRRTYLSSPITGNGRAERPPTSRWACARAIRRRRRSRALRFRSSTRRIRTGLGTPPSIPHRLGGRCRASERTRGSRPRTSRRMRRWCMR